MRRDNGRRLVYSAGYAAALTLARADRTALMSTFARDYIALQREVAQLKAEVEQLRALAVGAGLVHDPKTSVH